MGRVRGGYNAGYQALADRCINDSGAAAEDIVDLNTSSTPLAADAAVSARKMIRELRTLGYLVQLVSAAPTA